MTDNLLVDITTPREALEDIGITPDRSAVTYHDAVRAYILGRAAAGGEGEPRIHGMPVVLGEIQDADDLDGSGSARGEHIETTRGNVTDGGK